VKQLNVLFYRPAAEDAVTSWSVVVCVRSVLNAVVVVVVVVVDVSVSQRRTALDCWCR